MAQIKPVAHPPEMEDGTDYIVETDDDEEHYNFQVPEKGILVFQFKSERVGPHKFERTEFEPPLPDEIENTLRTYFRENHGDEIEIQF